MVGFVKFLFTTGLVLLLLTMAVEVSTNSSVSVSFRIAMGIAIALLAGVIVVIAWIAGSGAVITSDYRSVTHAFNCRLGRDTPGGILLPARDYRDRHVEPPLSRLPLHIVIVRVCTVLLLIEVAAGTVYVVKARDKYLALGLWSLLVAASIMCYTVLMFVILQKFKQWSWRYLYVSRRAYVVLNELHTLSEARIFVDHSTGDTVIAKAGTSDKVVIAGDRSKAPERKAKPIRSGEVPEDFQPYSRDLGARYEILRRFDAYGFALRQYEVFFGEDQGFYAIDEEGNILPLEGQPPRSFPEVGD